ncbi:hypothetical protein [Streptomyces formicae]|uniref:Uncharacterized protein n=1 Tax=Streptomyces formicae TaxID=1616117 RepID=A0A291Q795_9ACTN|nr:hypothetical protein [Streptomyces formicae]ATL27363.1 hypothetical protein KY5_2345c [Streptomyces formicae]
MLEGCGALEIPADPGLTIVTYTLAPDSPQAAAFLRLQQHMPALAKAPGVEAGSSSL